MEFALSESQADIDALLTATAWDEAAARRIVFQYKVIWGFQQYIDVFRAAWELNRNLPAGAQPLRVVGLGVRSNWELIKTEKDAENAEVLRKVLADGIPDEHMASVIQREFLDRDVKALVYCSLQHAFTRYRNTEYEKSMKDKGFTETRRAGSILYDRVGSRVATLVLHAPWPDRTAQTGLSYPVDGAIDSVLLALPVEKRAAGWDTAGTPIGGLAIGTSQYAAARGTLTLADFCDGYIATGPITTLHAATAIVDFVPADQSDYAARNFPGPKPEKLDAAMINTYIGEMAQSLEQALRRFK